MKFTIQREVLLKQLQHVVSVVSKKSIIPIFSNVNVQAEESGIRMTGTDAEVEVTSKATADSVDRHGAATIPARKLHDIARALPQGAIVKVACDEGKATVSSGRSRFTLSTLPSDDFPSSDSVETIETVKITDAVLSELIDRTAFAMAQNDVRYYLNGMLFDLGEGKLTCVATDGHRLAICDADVERESSERRQIIIPRKGILELQRMLDGGDSVVSLGIGKTHIRVDIGDVVFTSKLIDGRYPDYENVIPMGANETAKVGREALKAALQRANILANEKLRAVRCEFRQTSIKVIAHNVEQEEANEEVDAESTIQQMVIGFNVTYLLDAISALREDEVVISLRDETSSALICEASNSRCRHVVMPMRV